MVDKIGAGVQQFQGKDPNAVAQQYAQQNGISIEQAKAELKAKFGDPQAQQAQALSQNSIFTLGGNGGGSGAQGLQGLDPNAAAEQYAQLKGISLSEAKEELISLYGVPKEPQQQGTQGANAENDKAAFEEQLRSLGISDEAITQGQEAIKAEADEKGIRLPDPPKKPEQKTKSSFSFNA